MGLFRGKQPAFRAIADALGFLESDAATTEYENGPVKPRLDVQASLEAGVSKYSDFILLRTDVGGVDATVDIDVHELGDWTEIRSRGVTFAGVAGSEVPAGHDAWIIYAGIHATASALTQASIFTFGPTIGAGSSDIPLFLADRVILNIIAGGPGVRGSVNASPILLPLPWPILPAAEQAHGLRFRLATSGANSVNLTLGVLSAPPGVFRRLM